MRLLFILAFTFSFLSVKATENKLAEKVLLIEYNEKGFLTVNKDTVDFDELAKYLKDRLYKSYYGTGKTYDKIIVKKLNENTPDKITTNILKEIKEGQKRALNEITLQRYRQTFDSLKEDKKNKVRKRFPVLFQENYN